MRRLISFVVSLFLINIALSVTVEMIESPTCPHCAKMIPIVENLSKEYGFTFKRITITSWSEFLNALRRYNLSENMVLKVNNMYIGVSFGTPTMIIDGKYIMIGEFWANRTKCIKFGERYLCPSSKEIFLDIILGKNVEYFEGKRLSFNEIRDLFSEKNCKGAKYWYFTLVYCKEGYYYLPSQLFFYLTGNGYGLKEIEDNIKTLFEGEGKKGSYPVLLLGVILGISDGILNPCTISVIILLITYLISRGFSRRRILVCGLSFILGVFLVYLIFLLGLIYAFLKIPVHLQTHVNYILGGLLILLGILELKDYFFYGRGPSLKIPTFAKKRFEALLKVGTALSSFLLGFLAGSAEIPCAGIYPPTYARAVSLLNPSSEMTIFYVLWYMFWFVFPLSMIVLTVYLGVMKSERWKKFYEKNRRTMRLISGIIMVLLGITMIMGIFARLMV